MKTNQILILILIISFLSCKTKTDKNEKSKKRKVNYELVGDKDDILVEKFDSTITDENKYNHNNIIYKVGSNFKYKFEHRTIGNEIKFFKKTNGHNNWVFIDVTNTDSTTIKTLEISVVNGNPISKHIPEYNQTVLRYKLGREIMSSMSGAIENEENVWIHPPRDNYFKILELNPFPYIKAPYKIGTKWTWKLKIGDHWADKHWKVWNGEIENKYTYEITDKRFFNTEFGKIECFVIESKAKSRIGETQLKAYFNLQHGFVKLNYTNIDGSKTILELIEHSKKTAGNNKYSASRGFFFTEKD